MPWSDLLSVSFETGESLGLSIFEFLSSSISLGVSFIKSDKGSGFFGFSSTIFSIFSSIFGERLWSKILFSIVSLNLTSSIFLADWAESFFLLGENFHF